MSNKVQKENKEMATKRYLEINRKKHGFLWWICIGWWERPIATVLWLTLASICGFKGVQYNYYK